ncbi:hypothetical protein EW026_g5418 [Hermanssonia centrifuga]|uniref:Fungal-type protein kinase domain-containing protein n=1 Tax=Hermanssonia centrifuga TaxID=98765 RepID=A0A4S4KFY0_9APHY|nr:hypothetical protein EW026_g5418 [Hermanssonia centrifuga]
MYDSLISAIKKSKICPRMVFKKLSDITQEDSALRPDLAGFNATNGEPSDNANIWSSMQLCIDNCAEDAFDVAYDPNDREGLRVSEEGNTKFLGRMIHYAREQMSHQHRVFMFSLHIVHDSARIIRWDRMGAIVTEAFNFVLHPQILAEFLFRFSLLGPEGRGLDSSAELAGSEECHEFAEAVANYLDSFGERKPPHFDATLDASYPTYKIHIVESGSGAIRNTLVAIRGAYRDAQTLHRDISMANIMLDSNMNGFLNDWDRAIRLSASEADRATRTGTWRFLSIEQLGSKNKIHEIHDDLESCFWVFLYAALHHFRHLPAPFDMSIFEDVRDRKRSDGTTHTVGGIAKAAALVIGAVRNLSFDCRPLTEAIHHVSLIFEDLYTSRVGSGFRGDIAMEFQAAHAKIRADTEDPSPLIKFLDTVLDRDDWPQEDDALVDLYPPLKASYPLDEDENSYSAQDSPYIDHNHPPSPAAISDNVRGVCGTQPVVVEDQLGYIKRGAVRSRSHPASSEVNTNTEHPPPPALTSGETVGSDPRACELLIRIGKQPAPESVSYGADEPKVKTPQDGEEEGSQAKKHYAYACNDIETPCKGHEVAAAPSEPKMYGPLINAINTHRLCQGVTFKDISGRAQSGTKLKPDIGGFEGNEMQLYIELKPSERQDAFHDSHNPDDRIEKQTDESSKHRGQIIHYAAEQMAVQHRVSLLTISMTGRIARFIRWDRSGAIVTKAFDYVDSPHLLAEFLIRFSRLNAAQRGFDTTVTPADQHEIASLSSALERYADLFGKRLPTQLEEDQAGQQRAYKIPAIIGNGTRTALVETLNRP